MSDLSEQQLLEVDESIHPIQKEHIHGNQYPTATG